MKKIGIVFLRVLILCVPALVFVPHLNQFVFPFNSEYSDLLISHYPNILYIRRFLELTGKVPLWSNMIMSGYPLSADPLSGLFYPPGWILFKLSLPPGINLLIVAHLIFSGVGMYLFLKEQGLGEFGSLMGALNFELMPKIFGHIGEGHMTLVFAISWTPWLLLVETRRDAFRVPWRQTSCGFVVGMIILADIRWAFYAITLWMVYSFWQTQRIERRADKRAHRMKFWLATTGKWLSRVIPQCVIGGLIGAPLLLPLMEFTPLSTRIMMSPEDNLFLSLPISYLSGLIIPDIAGFAEWLLYPGIFSLLSLVIILNGRTTAGKSIFWIIIAFMALLFALGNSLPIPKTLASLVGFGLLRVPPRALFLLGFAFSVFSAMGFSVLSNGLSAAELRRLRLILTALAVFMVSLSAGVIFIVHETTIKIKFLWGAAGVIFFTTIVFLRVSKVMRVSLFRIVVAPLLVLDLCGVGFLQLRFSTLQQIQGENQELANWLSGLDEKYYRFYSPSYSLPQHLAAQHSIELADGINPMQIVRYVDFMKQATGVPIMGYSVTIPPFSSGNPDTDNRDFQPNLARLGILNVKYVISEFDLISEDLSFVNKFGNSRIYLNRKFKPRVWVQESDSAIGENLISQPFISRYFPDDITVEARGPGLLVLSEVSYPGWHVDVDDRSAPLVEPLGFLRGVQLSEGSHIVRFYYFPTKFYIGWVIFSVVILVLLISWFFVRISAQIQR